MSLKIILNNELLLDEIMKYLDQTSKISLSEVDRECNSIMRDCGYFENVLFRCNTINNYIKSLELLEEHRRTINTITCINQIDIFNYLPKGIENKYDIVFKHCRVYVLTDDLEERLNKIELHNCLIKNKYVSYYCLRKV
tara:strand:- start:1154 stop:1570 length:417 start_codon:yes stop_codon:yes gene_type:complete